MLAAEDVEDMSEEDLAQALDEESEALSAENAEAEDVEAE